MNESIKKSMPYIIIVILLSVSVILGTLTLTGCKSTIKMPEGLNDKCKVTWALIIAFHESGKNEGTKSAVALLLQESQKECYKSIDQKRIQKVSVMCREQVYGKDIPDLSDLKKKEMFINCIKIYEGEIK